MIKKEICVQAWLKSIQDGKTDLGTALRSIYDVALHEGRKDTLQKLGKYPVRN